MHNHDDRLIPTSTEVGQDAVQALTVRTEIFERIVDADRPIDAGDDAPDWRSVRTIAERYLDHGRYAVVGAERLGVVEALRIGARGCELRREMILTDDAEVWRLHRLGRALHRREQLFDGC